MGGLLLLVFIVVPILEIVVFIQAGEWIGLWPTLAGIVMTAVIGAALVRHQGLSVLRKAQSSLGEGRFPVAEVFDGLCLVIAGALLLTPGFLTDTAGFLLLIPPLRALLRQTVGRRMMASGRVEVWADGPPSPRPPPSSPNRKRGGIIIDADYEHVPEEPLPEEPPAEPSTEHPASGESPRGGPQKETNRRGGSPWRKGGAEGGGKSGKRKTDDR
jgi:UPF0716 protein FxsA